MSLESGQYHPNIDVDKERTIIILHSLIHFAYTVMFPTDPAGTRQASMLPFASRIIFPPAAVAGERGFDVHLLL